MVRHLSSTFIALRHPSFRLYFVGQTISLIGTWVQSAAQAWLVYRMTSSPLLLGLSGFMGQIPVLFLGLFGGVVADQYDRHRTVLLTQTLSMVQALILAGLVLTGKIQVWEIFMFGLFLGTVNAFDQPARQSFFIEMVGKEDLPNAIALNSSAVNLARLIGPVVAGLLIGLVGEGICFLINALSFLALVVGLLLIKVTPIPKLERKESVFSYLRAGVRYGTQTPLIRRALILLSIVSLMALPYPYLLPVFSRMVLKGDADIYGLVMGGVGLGALLGTLSMARQRAKSLEWVIFEASLGTGIFFILFAFSNTILISFTLMVGMGYCLLSHSVATNTLIQSVVPNTFRGRLMSFYGLVVLGISPFGSLLAGYLVQRLGAPRTILFSGIILVLGSLTYYAQSFIKVSLEGAAGSGDPTSGEIVRQQGRDR
ncbi:MAG TPA: MFS transporter [Nitrospiria bacterium]|nr:MFS transporter [Nitrospiria bacterium]